MMLMTMILYHFHPGSMTLYQCGLLSSALLSLLSTLIILATSINQRKEEPVLIWLFILRYFHQLDDDHKIYNILIPFLCSFSNLTINTDTISSSWVKQVSGPLLRTLGLFLSMLGLVNDSQESCKDMFDAQYQHVLSRSVSWGKCQWKWKCK